MIIPHLYHAAATMETNSLRVVSSKRKENTTQLLFLVDSIYSQV